MYYFQKLNSIKNKILKNKVHNPDTSMMEFIDKTRDIPDIHQRLLIAEQVYTEAVYIITEKELQPTGIGMGYGEI